MKSGSSETIEFVFNGTPEESKQAAEPIDIDRLVTVAMFEQIAWSVSNCDTLTAKDRSRLTAIAAELITNLNK